MPAQEAFTPSRPEEIVRRALAASAGVAPGRVPESLARAVATGKGERVAASAAARALGDRVGFDLVRFDTDRIASYVFESSRPPVLAGASKILRDLNSGIGRDHADWALLSAGGEGLLLAPRGRGEDLCRDIEERYRRASAGALGVTTASISLAPEDFLAAPGGEAAASAGVRVVSGTPALLARLHDAIRRRKDERLPVRNVIAGDQPRCCSCRDRAAGQTALRDLGRDEDGRLCDPCATRWKVGKDEIAGHSFEDLIERWTGVYPEGARRESYLGFLYADGNGMGALFGKLASLADLQALSLEVTRCFEALRGRTLDAVDRALPAGVRGRARKLVLDLLAGGDEAIWILPAALAAHVAERLPPWLDEEVASRPALAEILSRHGRRGVTVGIGLALCGLGYPVRYQYQLAKDLQKHAKDRRYASGVEESTIDFELLTDSSPLSEDFEGLRRLVAGTSETDFLRTCRPYSCGELTTLRERIERALARNLALSQLHALAAGCDEGRRPFLNFLRYQIARSSAGKGYREWLKDCGVDVADPAAIERFFVHSREGSAGVWIADALDLLPLFDGVRGRIAAQGT